MFPDLALKIKNCAADMGSGFVVIAGFLLAITMVFIMVFARWNVVQNDLSSYAMNADKPRVESIADETGNVTIVLADLN